MHPVDLPAVGDTNLSLASECYLSSLESETVEWFQSSHASKVAVTANSVRCLQLFEDNQPGNTLWALHLPEDPTQVVALYLHERWWGVDDVLSTSCKSRSGLLWVQSMVERVIVFLLSQVVERSLQENVLFSLHSRTESCKLMWMDGQAVGFYSVKHKGRLCDGWSSQCYLLPVLDTVLVRRSCRRRGFAFQMLKDFCSTFSSERFLGVSSPLTPNMVAVCRKFLQQHKEHQDRLYEVEAPGDWTQRRNIWLNIKLGRFSLSTNEAGMFGTMNSMENTQVARTIELNDGTHMPVLGLGTWKSSHLPRTSVQGAVEAAIAAGYRHIDTAYCYHNEVDIGKALRSKIQQGIVRRQDMFIVSKLWCTHHAPEDIPVCLNKSLSDLQLDYLDLYLVHFPVGLKKVGNELYPEKDGQILTSDIDYVDVWRGMEALQASGKVKSIGVSNFNILQLERLLALCRVPPAVNQVELHPYLVQADMIEFCKSKNIALTAYSPFGSPARPPELLTGDTDPHKIREDPVVADIAKKHRRSTAQVLLRYHVQQGISVIPKSDKPHHILENCKIFDFSLTEEDMRALRRLDRGWRSSPEDELKSHPYYPFV